MVLVPLTKSAAHTTHNEDKKEDAPEPNQPQNCRRLNVILDNPEWPQNIPQRLRHQKPDGAKQCKVTRQHGG